MAAQAGRQRRYVDTLALQPRHVHLPYVLAALSCLLSHALQICLCILFLPPASKKCEGLADVIGPQSFLLPVVKNSCGQWRGEERLMDRDIHHSVIEAFVSQREVRRFPKKSKQLRSSSYSWLPLHLGCVCCPFRTGLGHATHRLEVLKHPCTLSGSEQHY